MSGTPLNLGPPPWTPEVRHEAQVCELERELEAAREALREARFEVVTWKASSEGWLAAVGVQLDEITQLNDDLTAQREELEDLRMENAQLHSEQADAENSAEWKIWHRGEDGEPVGLGTSYATEAVEPFLARPDRWIVRKRLVRTWKGPWREVTA